MPDERVLTDWHREQPPPQITAAIIVIEALTKQLAQKVKQAMTAMEDLAASETALKAKLDALGPAVANAVAKINALTTSVTNLMAQIAHQPTQDPAIVAITAKVNADITEAQAATSALNAAAPTPAPAP